MSVLSAIVVGWSITSAMLGCAVALLQEQEEGMHPIGYRQVFWTAVIFLIPLWLVLFCIGWIIFEGPYAR